MDWAVPLDVMGIVPPGRRVARLACLPAPCDWQHRALVTLRLILSVWPCRGRRMCAACGGEQPRGA